MFQRRRQEGDKNANSQRGGDRFRGEGEARSRRPEELICWELLRRRARSMAPERPGSDDERCGNSVLLHANGVTVPIIRHPLNLHCDLLKEGDGATKVFTEVRVGSATTEDDDLTPLSWLQDRNLLKGIALRAGPMCPDGSRGGGEARAHRVVVQELSVRRSGSPTSDYADDSSEQPDSLSSGPSSSPTPSNPQMSLSSTPEANESPMQSTHPSIIPYNPKIHVTSKPPYSFSCLIFMAIEDSTQRALPVKDIYAWILDHFPYFQTAPTGWKNSVRHNLSLNKCFKKVDKSPNVGKGSLWMVDPMFRPNLLQALQKAPYHPYMQVDRQAPANSALPATSGNSSGKPGGDYAVPVLLSAPAQTPGRSNLPNPALFPFLSRRLAAAGLGLPAPVPARPVLPQEEEEEEEDSDSREDVDAATAMLALKHGPRILLPRRGQFKHDWLKRVREGRDDVFEDDRFSKVRSQPSFILPPQIVLDPSLVITSSPSEDHTYSAGPTNGSRPSLSPDEAFGEGSASSAESAPDRAIDSDAEEEEEQRKIEEGADALLNLAGICTIGRGSKRGNSSSSHEEDRLSKRQRLIHEKSVRQVKKQPPQSRLWKKASLHQGSRGPKNKNKDKTSRHKR